MKSQRNEKKTKQHKKILNECCKLQNIMSFTKSIVAHNATKSPLYILGAGSIGLLFASCMQLSQSRVPRCLLLRSHHEHKILKGNVNDFQKDSIKTFCKKTNRFIEKKVNVVNAASVDNKDVFEDGKIDGYSLVAFKDTKGEVFLLKVPSIVVTEPTTNSKMGYMQNILLCTKAPDAVKALTSILHLFHPTERINLVVMTNGSMGVVAEIKEMIHSEYLSLAERINIIFGSTYHGVHRGVDDPDLNEINSITSNQTFNVLHAGFGQIFIEDTDDLSSVLSNEWNVAGLRSNLISSTEMNVLNWKKLAANCAINPLTALRQCKNGDLITSPGVDHQKSIKYLLEFDETDMHFDKECIFYQLIHEVSGVAMTETKRNGFDDAHINNFRYDNLVQFVEEVVHDTAKNNSSMFQDVLHQRHPTEINYLNGYIAKLGREEYGLRVDANEYITKEVENLTKSFVKEE